MRVLGIAAPRGPGDRARRARRAGPARRARALTAAADGDRRHHRLGHVRAARLRGRRRGAGARRRGARREVSRGRFAGVDVLHVSRHGAGHVRLSNHVDAPREHRGAARSSASTAVLAVTVCGAVDPAVELGSLICFDDLHFLANRLPDGSLCTFYERAGRPAPRALDLRGPVRAGAARGAARRRRARPGVTIRDGGCYGHVDGPRFNTKAEIRGLAAAGVTAVSQTAGPETVLAGEARAAVRARRLRDRLRQRRAGRADAGRAPARADRREHGRRSRGCSRRRCRAIDAAALAPAGVVYRFHDAGDRRPAALVLARAPRAGHGPARRSSRCLGAERLRAPAGGARPPRGGVGARPSRRGGVRRRRPARRGRRGRGARRRGTSRSSRSAAPGAPSGSPPRWRARSAGGAAAGRRHATARGSGAAHAAAALADLAAGCDAVVGPTLDGDWYLAGARARRAPDLLTLAPGRGAGPDGFGAVLATAHALGAEVGRAAPRAGAAHARRRGRATSPTRSLPPDAAGGAALAALDRGSLAVRLAGDAQVRVAGRTAARARRRRRPARRAETPS